MEVASCLGLDEMRKEIILIGIYEMNKQELLQWAVENIRLGQWPTLRSGIKIPAPKGSTWQLVNQILLLMSCDGEISADDWEAAKAAMPVTRQKKYNDNLGARGLVSSKFTYAPNVKNKLAEIARKSREDAKNDKS